MDESDIETYFQDLADGGEAWRAMKVLILGNGRIGKTTLVKAITDFLKKSKFTKVLKAVQRGLAMKVMQKLSLFPRYNILINNLCTH